MNKELFEEKLAELPLFTYAWIDPQALEFSQRIRWICENECPMYGKTWACPPGVGGVPECRTKCLAYENCLMIFTITEVEDITNIELSLATRPEHEAVTNQGGALLQEQGLRPYILSTEACSLCQRCAILDGEPCRMPEKMHPCGESHGIIVIPVREQCGIEFQYGENVVTWVSLLFY